MESFAYYLCFCALSLANLVNCQNQSVPKEVKEFLAARQLYIYREYKDVQILHFSMPSHVLHATYNLTSNSSYLCGVRNISIFLQGHSYPVVTPDDAKPIPHMWKNRQPVFKTTLESNLNPALLTIPAPYEGDWFMIAFINDQSKMIRQAGLFPSCYAWLQVEATYLIQPNVGILQSYSEVNNRSTEETISSLTYFKYFLSDSVWSAEIIIDYCHSDVMPECDLQVSVRPSGFPWPDTENTREMNCNSSEACQLSFTPYENDWQYIGIDPKNNSVNIGIRLQHKVCANTKFATAQALSLSTEMKSITPFNDGSNVSESLLEKLNISTEDNEIFRKNKYSANETNLSINGIDSFENSSDIIAINESSFVLSNDFSTDSATCWTRYDLRRRTYPGNFAFEYDLQPDENGSIPLIVNLTSYVPSVLTFDLHPITDIGGTLSVELAISPFMNITLHNYNVVGCLSTRIRSNLLVGDNGTLMCEKGWTLRCNTSDPRYLADMVTVPYPEPVRWMLSLMSICYLSDSGEVTPCRPGETTILFSVSSTSCIHGKCGRYGSCFQYISGGFIFSTCSCDAGYRGWGCTDAAEAVPNWKLLLSTLLLTLSNLLFIPSIILALYRLYLTEAVVYFLTMFFSTFYHACDQSVFKYCVMPLSVLQFGDFYCAIMSFWVTLIAMAKLTHRSYSILHMVGALIVALGCEYNRTGLWVFAAPSIAAVLIMSSAWVNQSRKQKTCYPPRHYWLYSLLPGTVLATVGLICYAFFETEDNYYLIHSFWHSIMALSILCLLPPKTSKGSVCQVLNSEDREAATSDGEDLTINGTGSMTPTLAYT